MLLLLAALCLAIAAFAFCLLVVAVSLWLIATILYVSLVSVGVIASALGYLWRAAGPKRTLPPPDLTNVVPLRPLLRVSVSDRQEGPLGGR